MHDPSASVDDRGCRIEASATDSPEIPDLHLNRGADLVVVEQAHRGPTHCGVHHRVRHPTVDHAIWVEVMGLDLKRHQGRALSLFSLEPNKLLKSESGR